MHVLLAVGFGRMRYVPYVLSPLFRWCPVVGDTFHVASLGIHFPESFSVNEVCSSWSGPSCDRAPAFFLPHRWLVELGSVFPFGVGSRVCKQ
jgi:hypothetical protein